MAICVILSLTAIILTKEDRSVKTGVNGTAESIETVEEVGEALNAFAPRLSANGVVYQEIEMPSIAGMAYETESENLPQNRFKSATITIEATYYYDGYYRWERMTCYFTEDISYYVIESIIEVRDSKDMIGEEGFGNIKSWSTGESMLLDYKTEIYIDKDVSLMKISKFEMEQAKWQSISFKNSEPYKSVENNEKTCVAPKGLQLNQWYYLNDLESYSYSFSPIMVKKYVEDAVTMIAVNANKFELDNHLDFGNLDKMIEGKVYTYDESYGDYSYGNDGERIFRSADINLREEKCPMINYRYRINNEYGLDSDSKITCILENINATTIKKLENPNIGEIDEKALGEEE